MKKLFLLSLVVLLFIVVNPKNVHAAKKKKKANNNKETVIDDTKMFDSKTLKCLVCKNLIDELEATIYKVDPKKMIDTGTFRVNEKGEQKRQIVSIYMYYVMYNSTMYNLYK